jgi:hypothetical protein
VVKRDGTGAGAFQKCLPAMGDFRKMEKACTGPLILDKG